MNPREPSNGRCRAPVPGVGTLGWSLAVVLAIGVLTAAVRGADGDASAAALENALTPAERQAGWVLLFDGKTHAGWMNSDRSVPRTPVEFGSLNPHRAGHYMLVHTQQWADFVLALDFRISPRCNSGIFLRTASLTPRPGKDVGFNGLEIAIDDTTSHGFHDTGALYDLAAPSRNAMKPAGEWNHAVITVQGARIEVNLNGTVVNRVDLEAFDRPNRRPDGTEHKFDVAYRDHPRVGYIGLQDHGSPCWYKNIKLRPLGPPKER